MCVCMHIHKTFVISSIEPTIIIPLALALARLDMGGRGKGGGLS